MDITVDYQADGVALTIRNGPGPTAPGLTTHGGHGLLGMRERVRHRGGDLAVGPTDSDGWRVAARLPLGEPT